MQLEERQLNTEGEQRTLRILAVADLVEPHLYDSSVTNWLPHIDLLISCGDLPPSYLEFLASTLVARFVHVLGNHCYLPHDRDNHCRHREAYVGALNLNGRVVNLEWGSEGEPPLILAGLEGSPVYNGGPHQYTEQEAAMELLHMVPGLLMNKVASGRYLDVMVTHAPPKGIHDLPDFAHRGFESLRPFIEFFKPSLLLHGHSHRYDPMLPMRTKLGPTEIINVYGHALLELTWEGRCSGWRLHTSQNPNEERTANG